MSVDAALRTPPPALLAAWSLAFFAAISLLTALGRLHESTTPRAIALTLGLTVVLAAASVALWGFSALRTMPMAVAGLALLDASLPLLTLTSPDPASTRGLIVLLIVPTVIAAYRLTAAFYRTQLVIVTALCVAFLGFSPDDRGAANHIVETLIAAAVLIVGAMLVRRVARATAEDIDTLRRLALTDKLTGALNRRGLADRFTVTKHLARHGRPVGVVSIDIDHFKWFNDEHGHAAGDEVLRRVCDALREAAGTHGLVGRTGGEELVAIVDGPAEPVAETFRDLLARIDGHRVTASVGIIDAPADACQGADALWRLLDAADQAMYRAKRTGRDRVCHGRLDQSRRVTAPATPVPERAAVPARDTDSAPMPVALPGALLAIYAALGIVYSITGHTGDGAGAASQLPGAVLLLCLLTGVILATVGPLIDRFRWSAGVIGTDLIVAIVAGGLTGFPARMVAVMPLLLTGLIVARHFGRGAIIVHHVAVLAIYLMTPFGAGTSAHVSSAVINAAVMIGATELVYFLQRRNAAAAADLHLWSVTDPLTNLANRHGLELGFDTFSRAQQLTVLALDVDDFKGINDTYGHAAGDDALVRLAATLTTVTSADTVVSRTGGDEFVVLAPSMRPSALTSKIKRAAALLPVPLSVSVGSAVAVPHRLPSLWQLIDAADAALMRAKRARRVEQRSARQAADERLRATGQGDPTGAGPADAGTADAAGPTGAGPAHTEPAADATSDLDTCGDVEGGRVDVRRVDDNGLPVADMAG